MLVVMVVLGQLGSNHWDGQAASFFGIWLMACLVNLVYPFVDFDSISGITVKLLNFPKHDLFIFSRTLSVRHL